MVCGVPYCFLHLSNNMGDFVNSAATFPGGPGSGRYRRKETKRRKQVVRTPARSTDDVSGVLLDMLLDTCMTIRI